MDKKIFFGLLLLALATSPFAHSSPVESANDDDDYLQDKSGGDDYDDDDYEGEGDKKKSSTVSSLQHTDEPYKTEEYTQKAEAGHRVELKCLGQGLDHDTIYMWYNGSQIIAQGTSIVGGSERLDFSKKNGLLTIKAVNAYDDGVFRCRAFGKSNERYETIVHVHVNGPPKGITIGHNIAKQQNIAGNTLVYQAGHHDLRFKCNVAKARPEAKIDWIHNGNTILDSQTKDHDLKIEDEGVMVIKTLHARHAGDYQCEASNEFGQLKANFKIDVQYAPFFMHHHAYFNAEEGGEVELHCLYKAFPAPTSVRWLKGGSKIHDNEKYQINNDVREHHDRTKLLIKNVSKNDLVMYQCEVENELGIKRENVTLGVGPAPARFEGYKYINNIVYTDWLIKSHQQLTELQILYRNNAFGWRPKNAQITNRNEVREGEWKVQGSIELDAGEWEIMARAKNTEGWSDDRFSQEIPIKIPKVFLVAFTAPPQLSSSLDSIESQNQTSSASAIGHTMMGLVAVLLLHRFA